MRHKEAHAEIARDIIANPSAGHEDKMSEIISLSELVVG
jgi:hypothetical protein